MNETSATRARHHPNQGVRGLIYRLFGSNGSFMIRDIVQPRETNVLVEQEGCQLIMALWFDKPVENCRESAADSVYR